MLADDDDDIVTASGPAKGSALQQPAWMRALYERCNDWLGQLPSVRIFIGLSAPTHSLFRPSAHYRNKPWITRIRSIACFGAKVPPDRSS
jgi:hypothetical protein